MASSKHHARHRASRRARPISLLLTASAVAAAVGGAVLLSGGTYALWSSSESVAPVTVTSGTLTIEATGALDPALWSKMLPGEKVRQSFTVRNTGNIPAAISATAATGSTAFEVRLAAGSCTNALSGASATVTPKSLGTLAGATNQTVCLEVALTTAATPGQQVSFSVALTGAQVG